MTKTNDHKSINITSEIGKLEGVILHTPGHEVENMTPQNAERALYSDILNLSVSLSEYKQLEGVLTMLTETYQIKELLIDILHNERVKHELIGRICDNEKINGERNMLLSLNPDELATKLIEGVVMQKNSLTKYLSSQRYALKPLHNFFYTRDAAVAIQDKILISRMANKVREREAMIMEAIFDYHSNFSTGTFNPIKGQPQYPEIKIEGGDILVAREDTLLMGIGARTSSQGVDHVLQQIKKTDSKQYIIVQELPLQPESFIHLDMVFTFISKNECMVYDPVILKPNKLQTVLITIEKNKVQFKEQDNLITALNHIGMEVEPLYCGGRKDAWIQQREQWHSGANFFAVAPGKIIGYARNYYTIEELNNHGYEVISAVDMIEKKSSPDNYDKCVITLEGSELPRGGGGARCMTMPFRREIC
ncbi:MAG: arginine deiminase family protein [Bacteroidales bacterium]|nr:arginine deiminase family protein [Bacteroidales bacterium]